MTFRFSDDTTREHRSGRIVHAKQHWRQQQSTSAEDDNSWFVEAVKHSFVDTVDDLKQNNAVSDNISTGRLHSLLA
jgi:hypothetical protein